VSLQRSHRGVACSSRAAVLPQATARSHEQEDVWTLISYRVRCRGQRGHSSARRTPDRRGQDRLG
jgi:hypothetical protein